MNFYNEVLDVLKSDERFFSDDGQLLRNAVYEAAMQMDTKLIKALYANEETRKHFFTDVDGIAVFDKVGFGWVINNREFLPDSYTRYKNKIGLVNNKGEYISASNDVELVFPYKDCVLEGGQTKEDQKRSEFSITKHLLRTKWTDFFIRKFLQMLKDILQTALPQPIAYQMQII